MKSGKYSIYFRDAKPKRQNSTTQSDIPDFTKACLNITRLRSDLHPEIKIRVLITKSKEHLKQYLIQYLEILNSPNKASISFRGKFHQFICLNCSKVTVTQKYTSSDMPKDPPTGGGIRPFLSDLYFD